MVDDIALLRSYVAERSEHAFAELVRRHVDLVYSTALRRVGGDTHLAEDVCQKVFAAFAREAPKLVQRVALTGWLYTSSRYAAMEVVRTERRRRARDQEAYAMNEVFDIAPSEGEWERLRPVLDEAMDQLNERDREALLLRFFERRSLAEVGGKLTLSEDAARKCVDRALERLRGLLKKRGIGSTSAALGLVLANQPITAAPVSLATSVSTLALGPIGAATTPTMTMLQFMSTSKIVVGLASLVLALVVGTSLQETIAQRTAERRLTESKSEYEGEFAAHVALEKRVASMEAEAAELGKKIEETRSTRETVRVVTPTESTKRSDAWDPVAEGDAFIRRHPEVREALIAQKKAGVDSRYGALYAALGWNADQIAEFQTFMGTTSVGVNGLGGAMVLGIGTDIPVAERTARLNRLLGEEGMRKMKEMDAREPARALTMKVAAGLGFTAAPLTSQQANALSEAIPLREYPSGSGKARQVNWDQVVPAAQSILDPSQMLALERIRVAEQSQR